MTNPVSKEMPWQTKCYRSAVKTGVENTDDLRSILSEYGRSAPEREYRLRSREGQHKHSFFLLTWHDICHASEAMHGSGADLALGGRSNSEFYGGLEQGNAATESGQDRLRSARRDSHLCRRNRRAVVATRA